MPDRSIVRPLLRLSQPLWRSRRAARWSEAVFWSFWLRRRRDRIEELFPSNRPFPESFEKYLRHVAGRPVDVLEVGSGPIGSLGSRHPTRTIRVTPTDVLAGAYARIRRRRRIELPVAPVFADAERLVDQFGNDAFDLVYAENCIDHMEDAMRALLQMIDVVRPGGWVVLDHNVEEGRHTEYTGMHRWNFNAVEGDLWLWNRRRRTNVTRALAGVADVRVVPQDGRIQAEIRKHAAGDLAPAGPR